METWTGSDDGWAGTLTTRALAFVVVILTQAAESKHRNPRVVVLFPTTSMHPDFTPVFRAEGDLESRDAEMVDVMEAGLGLVIGKRFSKAVLSFLQLSCVSSSRSEYHWSALPLKQVEM